MDPIRWIPYINTVIEFNIDNEDCGAPFRALGSPSFMFRVTA